MRTGWAPLLALALVGCGNERPSTEDDWCKEFYARTNLSDYVDKRTGQLMRDRTTNEILDPETLEVAIDRREEECLVRQSQKAIDAYQGGD